MHILISNADGYNAPGLLVLADALTNQHHKVTIVAPRDDVSGCGMAISARRSINVEETAERVFIVDGTPADCIYIGLNSLVDEPVDLVISGINNGPNLADDILYSGTFAAAMEARRMAMPSIALSITERSEQHYETAAYIAVQMSNALPLLNYRSLLAVLNVNVPDIPVADLRGFKATVSGQRDAPTPPIKESGVGKNSQYRLGLAGDFRRSKRHKMQDFEAVEQGYASITPFDATFDDSAYIDDVQAWLDTLN
ncbi:MAG: 5'-nucleotidase [Arenicella sp.]